MARFNEKAKNPRKTCNHEGSVAYTMNSELELYSAVVTTTLSDSFYEKADDRLDRIQTLISKCDPSFVAKLAVYARENMYLRTIPLVLTVELAKIHSGDNLVSRLTERVVQRADEITELLGYYQAANNRKEVKKLNKLSNQLRKGLARTFYKFDRYQFQKYDRKTDIRLRDALFLTHPKAMNSEQQKLFEDIANDNLGSADTWEVKMSAGGSGGRDKKLVWEEMIDSRKMGYQATLRNLRNFINEGVSNTHLKKVAEYIENEKAVLNSKQLPFRFLSAYRSLGFDSNSFPTSTSSHPALKRLVSALEKAVMISINNIPLFQEGESVLIASDVSASMFNNISEKGSIRRFDIGLLLGNLLHNKVDFSTIGMFGDIYREIRVPETPLAGVNEMYRREGEVGYSTNGHTVIDWALKQKHLYDRICMFTDMQMWNCRSFIGDSLLQPAWNKYKQKNPNAKLYLFDLAGHGTTPIDFVGNDVTLIAGWSDKIFNFLHSIENGGDVLKEIQAITL